MNSDPSLSYYAYWSMNINHNISTAQLKYFTTHPHTYTIILWNQNISIYITVQLFLHAKFTSTHLTIHANLTKNKNLYTLKMAVLLRTGKSVQRADFEVKSVNFLLQCLRVKKNFVCPKGFAKVKREHCSPKGFAKVKREHCSPKGY